MTDHETPIETPTSLAAGETDVTVVEERLRHVLAAPIDKEATWSLVQDRIHPVPHVVPLRSRRRRWGMPALAVAAALLVSGVAWAAVAQRGGSSETHGRPGGSVPGLVPAATVRPGGHGEPEASRPPGTPPGVSDPSSTPAGAPLAGTGTGSPSDGPSAGSTQQPGQDQQGGQGQDDESPDPSGQGQQDQSAAGGGGDVQSDTSVATSGSDEGSSLPSSGTGDQ